RPAAAGRRPQPPPTEPAGPVQPPHPDLPSAGWRDRVSRLTTSRPVSLVIALVVLAPLAVAALQLRSARLGFSIVQALPSDTQENKAEQAAAEGLAPGILSPTEIVLEAPGV